MKLAIVGSRSFKDYESLKTTILSLYEIDDIEFIISGGAKGADTLAKRFAKEHQIPISIHKPLWEEYGNSAGIVRNCRIVRECDEVIAFWDGESKGTKFTIKYAEEQNKEVLIINV